MEAIDAIDRNLYVLNKKVDEHGNLVDYVDSEAGRRLDCFEAILGSILGADYLIEKLLDYTESPILQHTVSVLDYNNKTWLRTLKKQLNSRYGELGVSYERPALVTLSYEAEEADEDGVHYVLWFGHNIIWDPKVEVDYPNEDSWCQTCICGKLMSMMPIVKYHISIPWEQSRWVTYDPLHKHVILRNFAVKVVKYAMNFFIGSKPSDSHLLIQQQIDYVQDLDEDPIFNLDSFLLELEIPRFNK